METRTAGGGDVTAQGSRSRAPQHPCLEPHPWGTCGAGELLQTPYLHDFWFVLVLHISRSAVVFLAPQILENHR